MELKKFTLSNIVNQCYPNKCTLSEINAFNYFWKTQLNTNLLITVLEMAGHFSITDVLINTLFEITSKYVHWLTSVTLLLTTDII